MFAGPGAQPWQPACRSWGFAWGIRQSAPRWGAAWWRAGEPVHGRASRILHDGQIGVCRPAESAHRGRYHSLVVDRDSLPEELEITAWTENGTIMALAHREWPLVGLQFHPESI